MLYARSIRKNILYGLEAENGVPPEEVALRACARVLFCICLCTTVHPSPMLCGGSLRADPS